MTSGTSRAETARESLVDAARAVLEAAGPEALTVRDVAARAGCSTMLVYTRLGGKQGIVDALYIEGFQRLAAGMRATRSTADPVADLRRCAARYRMFARENPTYYAVMFERAIVDFEPSPKAKAVASGTLDVLADRVQRAIDAKRFPRQNARQLAACLWAANHGVVSLELKRVGPPDIDWASRHAQVIEALLTGLGS